MRIRTQFVIFVDRFRRKLGEAKKVALNRTAALIRLEARQSLRVRKGRRPSPPGNPPYARTKGGLREINYVVEDNGAMIGPRKFRKRSYANRPIPNIHEKGGIALVRTRRGTQVKRYPERSFMYRAVKSLQRKGKLSSKFRYMLRST